MPKTMNYRNSSAVSSPTLAAHMNMNTSDRGSQNQQLSPISGQKVPANNSSNEREESKEE